MWLGVYTGHGLIDGMVGHAVCRMEAEEDKQNDLGQRDMSAFYSNFMTRNIAMGADVKTAAKSAYTVGSRVQELVQKTNLTKLRDGGGGEAEAEAGARPPEAEAQAPPATEPQGPTSRMVDEGRGDGARGAAGESSRGKDRKRPRSRSRSPQPEKRAERPRDRDKDRDRDRDRDRGAEAQKGQEAEAEARAKAAADEKAKQDREAAVKAARERFLQRQAAKGSAPKGEP
jgi:hypothetical protein